MHINRNVKGLDVQALQVTINSISMGLDLDRSDLSKVAIEEMEKKIMQDFPRFMKLDLANVIGAFLKLSYVPRDILNELN